MSILILGCGNILRGDDGFGPMVIQLLERDYVIPSGVKLLDAGLGCGEVFLNLTADDERPRKSIVVDAVDLGLTAGEVKVFDASEINVHTRVSRHQFPDRKVVDELVSLGVEIEFVSCQVGEVPSEVRLGLSKPVADAVPKAAEVVSSIAGLKKRV